MITLSWLPACYGRVDMLCYLIHASVAFRSAIHTWNDLNLIKLLELFLKWIEKIQVGLLVALIELSGRLTLHLWEPGQGSDCLWHRLGLVAKLSMTSFPPLALRIDCYKFNWKMNVGNLFWLVWITCMSLSCTAFYSLLVSARSWVMLFISPKTELV